ncbi:MAG: DUF4387 domain-containing protein [Candidatus Velthaea sp.]
MTTLGELAALIRSKNAGPFVLTFDILFASDEAFARARAANVLDAALFARLYRCPERNVRAFVCPNARAFKFSIPRPVVQGDLGDGDLHGGQQFAPLIDIPIP